MSDRRIIIPYKPRTAFLPYHATTKRFLVTVAHRRIGKTVARINKMIKAASLNERAHPPPKYGYVSPYLKQSKDIAWLYLKYYAKPLLALGGTINESDLFITLPHNGAIIRLYGADNAESMRGGYFDGVVADESQGIARSVLNTIIMPQLADYKGWLDCAGTPKGWQNLLGQLVLMAKKDPENWFLQIIRASESGVLPESELAMQRGLMHENEYRQEYECDFDAAITGAVYGKEIYDAAQQGRLLPKLEPLKGVPVHTSWDLGRTNNTAIWWWQSVATELRILNFYQSFGQDIEHYCDVITARGKDCHYTYGKHYVPHDAANELLAAGGRSIVQQADALGVRMYVVPATSQQNSIAAAKFTLERSWFDETNCEVGLQCLRQYQFEYDTEKQVYRSKPRHDQFSDGADAYEIIGQVWRKPEAPQEAEKPRFLHETTANEVFWPKDQHRVERI